jgi:hypothetical protein
MSTASYHCILSEKEGMYPFCTENAGRVLALGAFLCYSDKVRMPEVSCISKNKQETRQA